MQSQANAIPLVSTLRRAIFCEVGLPSAKHEAQLLKLYPRAVANHARMLPARRATTALQNACSIVVNLRNSRAILFVCEILHGLGLNHVSDESNGCVDFREEGFAHGYRLASQERFCGGFGSVAMSGIIF